MVCLQHALDFLGFMVVFYKPLGNATRSTVVDQICGIHAAAPVPDTMPMIVIQTQQRLTVALAIFPTC